MDYLHSEVNSIMEKSKLMGRIIFWFLSTKKLSKKESKVQCLTVEKTANCCYGIFIKNESIHI